MDADTKTCPQCAETIKSAAKVCRHCGLRQGRFPLWRQDLPIYLGCLLMCLTLVPLFMVLPEEKGVGGRKFSGHRNELLVVESTLNQPRANSDFYLNGVITNQSDHAWRTHTLEVRFLDPAGKLIDARHPEISKPFVILPRHTHAFRALIGELAFTNSTVSHQVRVHEATDGDRPLKPD